MSAANSDQACPSVSSDEAMEPATKRARIEVKAFNQVDLAAFTLKNNGKSTGIKGGLNTFPLIANQPIRFNLTPSDWLEAPFGFDLSGKYENPSFLCGIPPEKPGASEGLSLKVNLNVEQAAFLRKLDGVAQSSFAELGDAAWNPLVASDAEQKHAASKIKVVLKGADLTKIAVVMKGSVTRGEGWDFLMNFLACSGNCKRAEVKLTVKVKKLWNFAKKAGLSLEATQMVLRIDKPEEEEAFGDDAELLA